jgi:hypothetical protein
MKGSYEWVRAPLCFHCGCTVCGATDEGCAGGTRDTRVECLQCGALTHAGCALGDTSSGCCGPRCLLDVCMLRNNICFDASRSAALEAAFDERWAGRLRRLRESRGLHTRAQESDPLGSEVVHNGKIDADEKDIIGTGTNVSELEAFRQQRLALWREYFAECALLAPRLPQLPPTMAAMVAQLLTASQQAYELHMLARDSAPVGSFIALPRWLAKPLAMGGPNSGGAPGFSEWMTCEPRKYVISTPVIPNRRRKRLRPE